MISFTVPGKPEPWRRARKNGKRHFKDPKTVANQDAWAWAAKAQYVGKPEPFTGALVMNLTAYYPIPASASKAKREAMISGQIRPTPRPDLDNIAKNADALNGLVFRDDAQIVRLVAEKFYGAAPRVEVSIAPIMEAA